MNPYFPGPTVSFAIQQGDGFVQKMAHLTLNTQHLTTTQIYVFAACFCC